VTDFITSLLKALAWSATFAAMLAGALRLGPGCLRQVRERAGLFMRTMLGVWILVPVFTIVIVLAFGVSGPAGTMLLLMAVCPGLPKLVTSAKSVRGSATTAAYLLVRGAAITPFEWWLASWRGGKNARRWARRQERHA
jgi:predicted permease